MLRTDRLREAREAHDWSQRDLADICHFGNNMVYRYEMGISDPSAKALQTMAEKLEVSTDYLLGLTNNPRGQLGDNDLTQDERDVLDAFRREGWPGLLRLGAERFAK
ncbi:MAG: helix-turn-helix transcriptional regulator [Chloroflexota bacterium]